jgi:hypothetical protein
MNYIVIEHKSVESTQNILDLIDCKKAEIILLNDNKVRGIKTKLKSHTLNIEKLCSFIKLLKPTDKILFIDVAVGFILPNSIDNIFSKHTSNQISLACQTNGNNELYIAQVMGFIPDIVTKNWSDNYIDEADLNQTELEDELITNINFLYDSNIFHFLNFNKYRVYNINYKVRAICISPKLLLYTFKDKRPYSLPEVIYKTLLQNFKKYLISGCWLSENPEMYKSTNERKGFEDCDLII